jgi:hypothetical protein
VDGGSTAVRGVRPLFDEGVLEAVDEGLPAGFDDVLVDADRPIR